MNIFSSKLLIDGSLSIPWDRRNSDFCLLRMRSIFSLILTCSQAYWEINILN